MDKFANQTDADRYYLSLAFAESLRSDDPKAKLVPQSGVGAVIASKSGLISTSANVFPPKIKEKFQIIKKEISNNERYELIEHAERGAIFQALSSGKDLTEATIYCTRFPCHDCARAISWSGIRRAVFAAGFANEKNWILSQKAALNIMKISSVKIRYLRVN